MIDIMSIKVFISWRLNNGRLKDFLTYLNQFNADFFFEKIENVQIREVPIFIPVIVGIPIPIPTSQMASRYITLPFPVPIVMNGLESSNATSTISSDLVPKVIIIIIHF